MRIPTALTLLVALGLPTATRADDKDAADLVVLDGSFAQVTLLGLLQVEAAPYLGDDALLVNGDPADASGFRLRRARFGFKGYAWGDVDFELTVDGASDGMKLHDAWVAWRGITGLGVVVGARTVPFSRWALADSGAEALSERPLGVRALAPFRQVGLTIEGDVGDGIARYWLGAYNGFTRRSSFGLGFEEATALDGNRFTRLAYVARAELAPLGRLGEGLPDFERGGLRLGLGGGFYYDDGKSISTLGWEIDAVMKVAGLHLALEWLNDSAEPTTQPTTDTSIPTSIDRMALAAEVGYLVCSDKLGVTARFELLDDDKDVDNGGDQIAIGGGVQYYLHRQHLKALLEFTHREELHGASLDNDALLLQVQLGL
ncbi:MAG: porin [Myxococcota bacterium]